MRNLATKGKSLRITVMAVAPLLLIGAAGVRAQSRPSQESRTSVQDNDTTRSEQAVFNQFLDSHQEIAEQLHRDPSMANNPQFQKDHPDFQAFVNDHPGIQHDLNANPADFMRQGNTPDRGEDSARQAEFNRFLDTHQEIAEQLRRDPSLANQGQFLRSHPALQSYLQDQPGIRQDLQRDPDAFMRQDDAFRGNVRFDNDAQRAQLMQLDQFLDRHPEIAEQLRKNPSLADQPQFLKTHPALQSFLQDQPAIRQDLRQDPNAFMRQEDALDRNSRDQRQGQGDDDRFASFHKFLGDHRDISDQLSRNPSRVKDNGYMKDHPELQAYLNTRPDVRDQLMRDPQGFVNGSQQFNDKAGQGYQNGGNQFNDKTGQGYENNSGSQTGKASGTSTPPVGSTPAPSAGSTPTPAPAPTNKK